MTVGNIVENFSTQLNELQDTNNGVADEALDGTQRPWMLPILNDWDGSPFTLDGDTGIGSAFNRDDANADYQTAVQTGTTDGGARTVDRMMAKVQVDYLAAAERAFRARHSTIVRSNLHAVARQQGQGSENGIFQTIQAYINSEYQQGHEESSTETE